MAGTGGKPRRPRLAPPATFDQAKRWPAATFAHVIDPGILAALLAAQEVALFVRRARSGLGWSQQNLADAADVHRDLVVTLEAGTAWLQQSSISRILAALDADLAVQPRNSPAGPRPLPKPRPRVKLQPAPAEDLPPQTPAEPGSQQWDDDYY